MGYRILNENSRKIREKIFIVIIIKFRIKKVLRKKGINDFSKYDYDKLVKEQI